MNKKIKLHSENDKMNSCPYENNQLDMDSSTNTWKANKELFFVSDIDKKIIESEENALEFLCNNPERIPKYIRILKEQFENWENDSR